MQDEDPEKAGQVVPKGPKANGRQDEPNRRAKGAGGSLMNGDGVPGMKSSGNLAPCSGQQEDED